VKSKLALILGIVLFAGMPSAVAADNSLDWPPTFDGRTKLLGMSIQDDFGFGMVNRLSKSIIPGPQPFCTSLEDPACTSLSANWWILRVLPPCIDTSENDDCVEGLEVTVNGETRKSVLVERIKERTWVADKTRGLPIAGSQGLWSDPFSTDNSKLFYINVFGDLSAMNNGAGPFPLANFSASITATSEAPSNSSVCIWRLDKRCGHRVAFGENQRLTLILHLNPSLTGWLGGRLNSPSISVSTLNSSVNRIMISGEPMNVNVVGATIPYESAPADLISFMRKQNPGCPQDECNIGTTSSGPHAFDLLENWKTFTKDTASRTIPYWSISRSPSSDAPNKCLSSGFVGLVTTNATAYQQSMPSLNGGELTYKVGGAHFMPDGVTLSSGTYNLLLRSDVARCVYGFSQAPIKASVSVVSESDIQSVATETVMEKDGWMYLAANGFHFSQPSIKVKLSQEAPTPPLSGSAHASNQPSTPKISITCQKGKVKKRVTGSAPTCPKGYKKVA
jgi:hypothetical protein